MRLKKTVFLSLAWGLILVFASGDLGAAKQEKSVFLCDFEIVPMPGQDKPYFDIQQALSPRNLKYPHHDFFWQTSGWAELTPYPREQARQARDRELYSFFKGKAGAKVRFTVPGDYKIINETNRPKVWESGITLSIDSQTPLKITDWSGFETFSLDVFNREDKDLELFIRFIDSNSKEIVMSSVVGAKTQGTIQLPLSRLVDKRINVADLKQFSLFLNTAALEQGPYLFIDNVQLNREVLTERRASGEEDEEDDWEEDEEDDEEEDEEEGESLFGGRLPQIPVK
jgi:hypothetical protein